MLWLASAIAFAGGGPLDVLILFNGDAPDARSVAEYYGDQRSIPADRRCAVTGVDPSTRSMAFADYQSTIQAAFRSCLAAASNADEIDYVVTVRGLPYRIDIPDGYSTSLEAMLQVDGAADDAGVPLAGRPQSLRSYFLASFRNPAFVGGAFRSGDTRVDNPYSSWYQAGAGIVRSDSLPWTFERSDPWSEGGFDFQGHLFVVTRLDGFDFQDARDLVDRAVSADGTFPVAELLCMRGADEARAARDPECEFVSRMLEDAGLPGVWLDAHDPALSGHTVAAYFTGTAELRAAIDGQTYVPGAIADNLTSTGAYPENFFCSADGATCPEVEAQTSIARFVRAGVTGVHGTVNEPLNNVFPAAGTLLLYSMGYNLGESYFFNTQFVYWQNLVLGDPLTTPYAERPQVVVPDSVPAGEPIAISATHPDGVAALRVVVDGEIVADDDVDAITVALDGPPGTVHEVLAIAYASPAVLARPGWPVAEPAPLPDVQGWTKQDVTITESPIDDTDGPDTDIAVEPDACGCSASPTGGIPLVMVLSSIVWLGRSRRRSGERDGRIS
jgi:uncharacterized protein (TIGR03790 family)